MRAASLLALLPLLAVSCAYEEASFREPRALTALLPDTGLLRVRNENGAILVRAGAVDQMVIEAEVRAVTEERMRAVQIFAESDDAGVTTVWAEWPGEGRRGSEGVHYEVTVPADRPLDLVTSNGRVQVIGMRNDVVARTTNGSIEVSDAIGELDLETSNGRITTDGTPMRVRARSSNGSVTLRGVRETAEVRTSNGTIEVALAPGAAGPVDLHTSNGKIQFSPGDAFCGTLEATTSNGSIGVHGLGAGHRVEEERRRCLITFPHEGPASRLRTSNGTISITGEG